MSSTKELESKLAKKKFRAFRRTWVPAVKTITASIADLAGDWLFYYEIVEDRNLSQYATPTLIFAIIATVMGFATIVGIFVKGNKSRASSPTSPQQSRFLSRSIQFLLGAEILVEDIPQFVISSLVLNEKSGGDLSGVAIFNITTSAFNFTFNLLDMFMPLDEEEYDDEEIIVDDDDKFGEE